MADHEMSGKPLTKERREEIRRLMVYRADVGADITSTALADLLAAEAYWREAVKQTGGREVAGNHDGIEYECTYCHVRDTGNGLAEHIPDCRWVLAQEND